MPYGSAVSYLGLQEVKPIIWASEYNKYVAKQKSSKQQKE